MMEQLNFRLDTLRCCDFLADCVAMETTNAGLRRAPASERTARQIAYPSLRGHRCLGQVRLLLFALLVPVCFHGCSFPLKGPAASVTRDHAFIKYWPADPDSKKLRLAVKDVIDMKGEVTTAGSKYLADTGSPATRDAACLAAARGSNVHIVGKTNLTEFAMGTSGMNEYYGTPVNPLDHFRIPGGSSSGSAVAVANGSADVAFGSDSAGSVRVPAACCGILGLKTTYGLVPLAGVFPLSPKHLDTIGPLAKDVPRLVQGMELLSPGFSARYRAAHASAGQIRIGRLYLDGTDRNIDRAIDAALTAKGFRLIRLDDQFKKQWIEAKANGTTIVVADGWLNNHRYVGKLGVSLTTTAAIQLGQVQLNTNYKAALRAREKWRQTLARVLGEVDLIAVPTLNALPPHKPLLGRSAFFEARLLGLQNTVAVNYAGNPAVAIPIPLNGQRLPASLQLIGKNFGEAQLVNAARLLTSEEQPKPVAQNRR
jgi:Asp-tRNA(Asn)/Glu-tRNA(Gln) amidotransferase A subunit family amidase